MVVPGVDYSFSRPSPSCLVKAGFRFACRYTSMGSPEKEDMTPAEVHALNAAGLNVVTVFQETKGHMLGGRHLGAQAATESLEITRACGMPPGRPHYFALDVDPILLSSSDWENARAYLAGAAEVLGRDQVGVYGGRLAIETLVPTWAKWGWQTSSWSEGRWSSKAVLQQFAHNVTKCGGLVDLNQAVAGDYGGWRETRMKLVTRPQWSAREPENRTPLAKAAQKGTAVHYSGAATETKTDHGRCGDVVRSIQSFHMDGRGWDDIAYSYLVCIHGYVFEGRGRGTRTAAQGTTAGNDAYHAVCFLGGDVAGRADVTPAGLLAIRQAVDHCNFWAGVRDVQPHSHFKATDCPGDELRAWIARGLPVATNPPEEDEVVDKAQEDRIIARVAQKVIDGLRSGFGGVHPGATGPQVRNSQVWLFHQIEEQAKRLQAIEDTLASQSAPVGDAGATARATAQELGERLIAPRP